jgi:hypothetical protein
VTILQALDSPTMYNRARENLDNVKWPDVTAGTRKNGNPYCYLMEGYVRLATLQEIKDWMKIMQDPSGKLYGGYQKEVWKTSSTGKKVYLSDFEKRMQGRNLLQELERAGIKNLDAVRKEGLGGLTFRYERWGVSSGYQTFKLASYMHYTADHWSFRIGERDRATYFLDDNKSYFLLAIEYITWTAGDNNGDVAALGRVFENYENWQAYPYPMSTFVLQ